MNITELFEMQRVLDERIIKEHGLEGKDLLQERVLALNVELAELAQETRCFKFWSKNQQPSDRVLDELVDVLHFILSVGINTKNEDRFSLYGRSFLKKHKFPYIFNEIFYYIAEIAHYGDSEAYYYTTEWFLVLVDELGFTWDQVVEAYKAKNAENHARQDRGY